MRFLRYTALVLALAPLLAGAAETKRPNIIFILCDDLGYGDLGVAGQNARRAKGLPSIATPAIDRMAAEGVRLEGMYCPAPVCAPSRGSLLAGVHQGHAGVRDNQFDKALEDNHTLATVLGKAGYATAAIGKWGLQGSPGQKSGGVGSPDAWPAYPTKRGFDYYFGYVRHGDGHEHYPKEGLYRGKKQVWDNDKEISDSLDGCYTTDLFTARAKKWIADTATATPEKPFFLYLAYDTPHAVDELPTGPYPAGSGLHGGLQWTGKPGAMINTAGGKPDSYYYPGYEKATFADPSTGKKNAWPESSKRYASSVRRIDDCVGDLVALLKDLKIDDNTLVVFTTDNGPSEESYMKSPMRPDFLGSSGPFDGIKRDCWEGGVRVGAIVRDPGLIPAGRTDTAPAQFHDWMPTFAELAGITAPARADGVSLVPALTGKGARKDSTVYVEYDFPGKTPGYDAFLPQHRNRRRSQMQLIRLGNLVGVRYDIKNASDDFEIYDIAKDPQESKNLAKLKPDTQRAMKDAVLRLRRPDESAKRPYDNTPVPALSDVKSTPGLNWKTYAGPFPWLAKTDDLPAEKSGTAASPADLPAETATAGETLVSGYLVAPVAGEYTLILDHGARSLLRIHDATVIDAGFGTGPTHGYPHKIVLGAGMHPFRLYAAKSPDGKPPVIRWQPPGATAPVAIPASAFVK